MDQEKKGSSRFGRLAPAYLAVNVLQMLRKLCVFQPVHCRNTCIAPARHFQGKDFVRESRIPEVTLMLQIFATEILLKCKSAAMDGK